MIYAAETAAALVPYVLLQLNVAPFSFLDVLRLQNKSSQKLSHSYFRSFTMKTKSAGSVRSFLFSSGTLLLMLVCLLVLLPVVRGEAIMVIDTPTSQRSSLECQGLNLVPWSCVQRCNLQLPELRCACLHMCVELHAQSQIIEIPSHSPKEQSIELPVPFRSRVQNVYKKCVKPLNTSLTHIAPLVNYTIQHLKGPIAGSVVGHTKNLTSSVYSKSSTLLRSLCGTVEWIWRHSQNESLIPSTSTTEPLTQDTTSSNSSLDNALNELKKRSSVFRSLLSISRWTRGFITWFDSWVLSDKTWVLRCVLGY